MEWGIFKAVQIFSYCAVFDDTAYITGWSRNVSRQVFVVSFSDIGSFKNSFIDMQQYIYNEVIIENPGTPQTYLCAAL